MRALLRCGVSAALLAATCMAAPAMAQAGAPAWVAQFAHALKASAAPQGKNMWGPVKFFAGNNQWQPGRQYRTGDGWLALACGGHGCVLAPGTLRVDDAKWQGHYDDTATAGQRLAFQSVAPAGGTVLAWFRVPGAPVWLQAGNVATYYAGPGRARATPKGTLEARVDLPGGDSADIVPMVLSAKLTPALAGTALDNGGNATYFLQLRAHGKRQLLTGFLGTCAQGVDSSAGYLLWAGDLDRDGKPDYLVSFVDSGGQVQLYLSSLAQPGQIVGWAGSHESEPNEGECDGDGWEF